MIDVLGDYSRDGYALVKQLIPPEVARAMVAALKDDIGPGAIPLSNAQIQSKLLNRPAFEVYGQYYKPMLTFLWGLTPIMIQLTGKQLLPTYDYLRIYREGDVCKVHYDRPSCEHSLSLTLDYSDGELWPLEIGLSPRGQPNASVTDDFADEPFKSLVMGIGDAVLYRGTRHRHGRIHPNPNAWSVHLFLHWVDRQGPYADHAFDRKPPERSVNFTFA
jgi:hypothetical protein